MSTQAIAKAVLEALPEPPDASDHHEDAFTAECFEQEGMPLQAARYRERAAKSKEAWAKWAGEMDMGRVRQAIRGSMTEAKGAMDAVEAAAIMWGTEAGNPNQESPSRKKELAKRMAGDKRLMALTMLAGRMVAFAESKRATTVNRPGAKVVGVTTGKDLRRALPSELALLDTEMEDILLLKAASGALMQWQTRNEQKASRGPVVILVDQSGSMGGKTGVKIGDHEVTYNDWASALSVAIVIQATKDGRTAHVATFDTKIRQKKVITPGSDMAQATDWILGWSPGGGTSWTAAIQHALSVVESMEPDADVLLVTDDQCGVDDGFRLKWAEDRKRLGITCFGLDVSGRCLSLQMVSDQVWSGDVGADDAGAIDLSVSAVIR